MAKWEVYFDPDWKPMQACDSDLLEALFQNSFQKDQQEVTTKDFSFDQEFRSGYTINFRAMEQTNLESKRTRKLRRTPSAAPQSSAANKAEFAPLARASPSPAWSYREKAETNWEQCDETDSSSLEALYRQCGRVKVLPRDDAIYDFERMTKTTNKNGRVTVIELRRETTDVATWECKLDSGWTPCHSDDSKMLEEKHSSYLDHKIEARVRMKEFTFNRHAQTDYEIDFDADPITQKNMESGVARQLRRKRYEVKWQYRDPGWGQMEPDDAKLLEARYANRTQEPVFCTKDFSFNKEFQTDYKIDFVNMNQTNLESGKVRDLVRSPLYPSLHPSPDPIPNPSPSQVMAVCKTAQKTPVDWRTDCDSLLFVPQKFRDGKPDDAWLEHDHEKKDDGTTRLWNEVPPGMLEFILDPFLKLDRHGCAWEKSVFELIDRKLHGAPKDCSCFGNNFKGVPFYAGFEWEVKSVHFICDEKRLDEFSRIPVDEGDYECDLFFHGTKLHVINKIIKDGFRIAPKGSDMWFGNGAYFTNCMPYAQHYIGRSKADGISIRGKDHQNGFQLPRVGNTIYIIGAMLKPGKVFDIPKDTTHEQIAAGSIPKDAGYTSPYRNRDDPEPGYHSHAASVSPCSGGLYGFRPLHRADSKGVEEIVMFDQSRMIPRFIIGMSLVHDGQSLTNFTV